MSDHLQDALDESIGDFGGRLGYAFKNLRTGDVVTHNADVQFHTASTIKLPILTAFYAFMHDSRLRWDDAVHVTEADIPGGSGILQHLSLPSHVRYTDAAWLMICVSDNLATNILLRTVGMERTNQIIHELVGPDLSVLGIAKFSEEDHFPDGGDDRAGVGVATPNAFLDYLALLHDGRLPGADQTIAIARQQMFNDGIPRYLPYSAYGSNSLKIAHKTGSLPGLRADVGILSSPTSDVAMVIMTEGSSDLRFAFGHPGQKVIGRLARAVYDEWVRD